MIGRSLWLARWRAAPFWVLVAASLLTVGWGAPSVAQDTQGSAEDWARLPEIRVGDYWEYELSGRENGVMMNEVVAEERKTNEHFEVTAQTFRIASTGVVYSSQATPPLGLMQNGQPVLQGLLETEHKIDADKWVRVDDHATLQMEGEVIIEGIVDAEVIEVFDPPFVHNFYPHTQGYKWVSTADYFLQRGGDDPKQGEAVLRAHVTDIETIEVPAGSFRTWRVEIDIEYEGDRVTANIVQWRSQEVCGLVKEERYDTSGDLVNRMELKDYDCSGGYVEEPDYAGRGVQLTATGGQQPPWLEKPLEVEDLDDEGAAGPRTASALPTGPVIWIAVGVMAGAAVMFFVLSRRTS